MTHKKITRRDLLRAGAGAMLVGSNPLGLAAQGASVSRQPHWTEESDVVWATPSTDASGAMPMGNGEVGINFWAAADGNLHFIISRTDTFTEISRLVKVGGFKVSLTPNPFTAGAPFRQALRLRDGLCEITAGVGAQQIALRVFVDADEPVVHCVGTSAGPIHVRAQVESWRTEARTIAGDERNSAWTMNGAPFPLVEAADVFAGAAPDAVQWYHRNEVSTAFTATLDTQALEPFADKVHDPLLHRTFGGWMTGRGFTATDATTLATASPVRSFALRVAAPCLQAGTAQEWSVAAGEAAARSADAAQVQARTAAWWRDYWDRSWVVVRGDRGFRVPGDEYPLRIGYDSNKQNTFPGDLEMTAVYDQALSDAEIARLAADRSLPVPVSGAAWTGNGVPTEIPAAQLDFRSGFTLSAWFNSDGSRDGRIFDRLTAGGTDGFLLDTYPRNTLRFIIGSESLQGPSDLFAPHTWHHAAATVDASTGAFRVYLDGRPVLTKPGVTARSPVTQGYTLQRYMQACGGRGRYPIKYNGGTFTVTPVADGRDFNNDYRAWGDAHWFQNIRHMYHPMPAGGDAEMMAPFFRMYQDAVPLAEERSRLYYGASGCYFPETMTVWGTYANSDYGWDRKGKAPGDVDSPWWRWAWNQGPELVGLLLDRWDYTGDEAFARAHLLPVAVSVLTYFDTRFPKDADGHIHLSPAQVIETFRAGVVNDMPTTAGLNDITRRLCALPARLTTPPQRAFFARMQAAAPSVPVATVTVDGKPTPTLAPAQHYDPQRSNCENPELYAIWPFRLYGVGRSEIETARTAYRLRANHLDVGWGYDGNCAALLGLADEAARILRVKCANSNPHHRWPATWGPNFDWLPDQNHGGNLLETTQLMLLQPVGRRLYLLPGMAQGLGGPLQTARPDADHGGVRLPRGPHPESGGDSRRPAAGHRPALLNIRPSDAAPPLPEGLSNDSDGNTRGICGVGGAENNRGPAGRCPERTEQNEQGPGRHGRRF